MTTIEITKEQIIKAIETEPVHRLRAGSWAASASDDEIESTNLKVGGACTVCAVGAVMRNVLAKSQHALKIQDAAIAACNGGDATAGYHGSPAELKAAALRELKVHEAPMAALSSMFEGTWAQAVRDSGFDCIYPVGVDDYRVSRLGHATPAKLKRAEKLAKNKAEMNVRYKNNGLVPAEIEKVRAKVLAFVKRHFPKTMLIDIDGAKPARDVKVVRED